MRVEGAGCNKFKTKTPNTMPHCWDFGDSRMPIPILSLQLFIEHPKTGENHVWFQLWVPESVHQRAQYQTPFHPHCDPLQTSMQTGLLCCTIQRQVRFILGPIFGPWSLVSVWVPSVGEDMGALSDVNVTLVLYSFSSGIVQLIPNPSWN
jgi:hypothetical protein